MAAGGWSKRLTDHIIHIQLNEETGLLYATGQGGLNNLWGGRVCIGEQSQVEVIWEEEAVVDTFYTGCQLLFSDQGRSLPLL